MIEGAPLSLMLSELKCLISQISIGCFRNHVSLRESHQNGVSGREMHLGKQKEPFNYWKCSLIADTKGNSLHNPTH